MDTAQINAVNQLTSKSNTKGKSSSKGQLQSLLPKTCSMALSELAALMQLIVNDGSVTRGEYMRLLGEMHRIHVMLSEDKKLKDLLKSGKKISGKRKTLSPNLPGVPDVADFSGLEF